MSVSSQAMSAATPQRSAWLRTAGPAPDDRCLDGSLQVSCVVVGAGYTGLNAAIRLAELGRDCVVVEAETIGFGASGRNGGQVIPGLKHDPSELMRLFGAQRGERLACFAGEAATKTFARIAELRLDCGVEANGWLQPAVDQQTLDLVAARSRMWHDFAGVETRLLSNAETQALTGTDFYVGGWIDPRGGQLQPLSYARELARAAIERGVRLYGGSPVVALRREGQRWLVTTPGGEVKAERVILCTNGYTGRLAPGLDRAAIPASSIMCATKPLPEALRRAIMPGGLPISDARRLLAYMRYDSEGRFMIGARGSFGLHEPESYFARLRATAVDIFPQLADATWEDAWGGRFALTVDHLPHIHEPAKGLFAAIGCNGRGVAMMSQIGGLLAELASDALAAEDCPVPVTTLHTIPFHALRRPGLEAVTMWYRFRDRVALPAGGKRNADGEQGFLQPPFGG